MNPIQAYFLPLEEIQRRLGAAVPPYEQHYQYGVVFGCKVQPITEGRLKFAVELYRQGKFDNFVLLGGRGYFGKISESLAMKQQLQAALPEMQNEHLHIESSSRNTWQNIQNLVKILPEGSRGTEILCITSAFHLPRVMKIVHKAIPDASGIAVPDWKIVPEGTLRLESLLMSSNFL